MSDADWRISADLAIVGRTSRAALGPLEATIRHVGAQRPGPVGVTTHLCLAPLYASRIARLVAGGYLVLVVAALVVALGTVRIENNVSWFARRFDRSALELALSVLASAAIVYVLTWGRAVRAAERIGAEILRHRIERLDRWSLVASITAPVAAAMVFGLSRVALGEYQPMLELYAPARATELPPAWWWTHLAWVHVSLGASMIASMIAGVVASRWSIAPRWIAIGVVVFAATVIVGARFDAGPINLDIGFHRFPSYTLRVGLTIAGFASLVALVAGLASARRRRELATLD